MFLIKVQHTYKQLSIKIQVQFTCTSFRKLGGLLELGLLHINWCIYMKPKSINFTIEGVQQFSLNLTFKYLSLR